MAATNIKLPASTNHSLRSQCLGFFFDHIEMKRKRQSVSTEAVPTENSATSSGGATPFKNPLKAANKNTTASTARTSSGLSFISSLLHWDVNEKGFGVASSANGNCNATYRRHILTPRGPKNVICLREVPFCR